MVEITDLKIACRTTCGCGGELVPYTKQTETTHYLLTCKAFSEKYDHPLLIAIDKSSPIFVKAEKWDKRDSERTNMLTESNTKYRQENKQLKEDLELYHTHDDELIKLVSTHTLVPINELDNLKQKLEKIEEFCKNMEESALREGGNNPYLNSYTELKEILGEKE